VFIQLAYPWHGRPADEILEVSDATGRTLIRDGNARLAPKKAPPKPTPKTRPVRELHKEAPPSSTPPAKAGPESEGY
jgi:hypothetical protein